MRLHPLRIPGHQGEICALRYEPAGEARDIAVIHAHGFTAGKYTMDQLAGYLAGHGYSSVTFDFVGHKLGGTAGALRTIDDALQNLRDVLSWVRDELGAARVALVGHSMGAAVSIAVAAEEMRARASWSAGAAPVENARLAGVAVICVGTGDPSRAFATPVGSAMLAQREDHVAGAPAPDILRAIGGLTVQAAALTGLPVLVVAAQRDVLVSPRAAQDLARLAGAEYVDIDASHVDAPDRARTVVSRWLDSLV